MIYPDDEDIIKSCVKTSIFTDKRTQQFKQNVDINFFRNHSPQMAYVLGCFASDGGMFVNSGGSKYTQFVSTDKAFLKNIKKLLKSNHKISKKKHNVKSWNDCYLMQIGSKDLFNDLEKFGFTPNKSKCLSMPNISNALFKHFVRGYFEGDGCVWYGTYDKKDRKTKPRLIQTHFICGDKSFLKKLSAKLALLAKVEGGSLVDKNIGFDLSYSKKDSIQLYNFMYNDKGRLFSTKKHNKFKRALEFAGT